VTSWKLGDYEAAAEKRIAHLREEAFVSRLWERDPGLWSQEPGARAQISNSLGWLDVGREMEKHIADIDAFAEDVRGDAVQDVVHMGMGGSSLAPFVLSASFGPREGWPRLRVLDTTDPASLRELQRRITPGRSLFIEASKSGTTAEPLAFGAYFYDRLSERLGGEAGQHMATITDPGSPLIAQSEARGYRRVFLNFTDIGGRYSALSYFGLVPARLSGIDIGNLLHRANRMASACREASIEDNPGIRLGAILGELALQGRDKLTLVIPEAIGTFGLWLEQLVAESTGKAGTGILPVAGERLGGPSVYGHDRVFVALELDGTREPEVDALLSALQSAGHPVIRLRIGTTAELGAEFFRWEIATATAGAVLAINPFDQPNVQESKANTNRLLDRVRDAGGLPATQPTARDGPLSFYGTAPAAAGRGAVRDLLDSVADGDYVALHAYLPEIPIIDSGLEAIRLAVRDRCRVATTVGYGPRFLHSTGQYHKGGPNTGVFLQLTADDPEDVPIPGQPFGFSTLKRAQALGDLEALQRHDRRVLRVDLGGDPAAGLSALSNLVNEVLEAPDRG
jgi:glucose-6-phosphate isomerase